MPRKDKVSRNQYQRDYMRLKRQGLTGTNRYLNIGARGFEPPTSASRTLRATRCATPRCSMLLYDASPVETSMTSNRPLRSDTGGASEAADEAGHADLAPEVWTTTPSLRRRSRMLFKHCARPTNSRGKLDNLGLTS